MDAAPGAELDACETSGFVRTKGACKVLRALGFHVCGNFAGKLSIATTAAEESEQVHSVPLSLAFSPHDKRDGARHSAPAAGFQREVTAGGGEAVVPGLAVVSLAPQ